MVGEIWWGDDDGPEALTREQEVLEQELMISSGSRIDKPLK
jgi:hypothetical protein